MNKAWAAFGLVAGLVTAAGARAEVGIAGNVGTTGVGFHTSIPLRANLSARLGLGYLGYSHRGSTKDLRYDLDLTANTYDALLDWYPRKNSAFRLTTGLTYNGNKIEVRARPDDAGRYTLQGTSYDAASVGQVTGKVDFNKIAPYIGFGWGRAEKQEKGWSVAADVGVLLQGSPKTSLSVSGCTASADTCNRFADDVARENGALRDEVSRFKAYPVLRIGVSYKF